jgi:FkbM family methyltransferase
MPRLNLGIRAAMGDAANRLTGHQLKGQSGDDQSLDANRPDGPMADERDLYYCYRLLLDREPDKRGWRHYGHEVRRGWSVRDLVHSFVTSPEFLEREAIPLEASEHEVVHAAAGFDIYVNPRDWVVGRPLHDTGEYEPHVADVLTSYLTPGANFLDVGANIGYYSLLAASRVGPQGVVIACEPNPYCCALLLASARRNKLTNVQLFPFGASDAFAFNHLETSDSNGELAALPDSVEDLLSSRLVFSAPLDWIVRDQHISVIKLDVEGAEHLALSGARRLLERSSPVIISEFCPRRLELVSGVNAERYLQLLIDAGYSIASLTQVPTGEGFTTEASTVVNWLESTDLDHLDILAVPSGLSTQ